MRRPLLLLLLPALLSCGSDDPAAPMGRIELSTEAVTFFTEPGVDPESQTVEVTNTGPPTITDLESAITYGVGQPSNWLNAPLSQSTPPGTVTLAPTIGALPPGHYTATVAVSGKGASNSPRNVGVTLRIATFSGYPTPFTQLTTLSPNMLVAQLITVPANAVFGSANVILASPVQTGTHIKVGIYTNVAGSPGTVVASSPSQVATVGRNELPLPGTISIAAGNYWFALVAETEVGLTTSTATTVTHKLAPHTFANALPVTFPTSTSQSGSAFNFFLKTFAP